MTDKELEHILSQWQVEIPDDRDFRRDVWKKIDHAGEFILLNSVIRSVGDFLMRPSVGIPVAAALIALSAWLAFENGTESRDAAWAELASAYQQTINPLGHHQ